MTLTQRINSGLRRVPTWLVYLGGLGLAAFWFYQAAFTSAFGPEPVKALEHAYGELALQLLILGLAITPLRRFTGIDLVRFRRAIGVTAFVYVALHLLVWLVLDVQVLAQVWADILKRPYITIGMAGFLLLIPLALTSNNWSVRKLGPVRWRGLHKLTYAAVLLGGIHFVMLAKTWHIEPMIYNAVIVLLLALRLKRPARGAQRA